MSRVTLDEAKSYMNVYFDEKDTEIQLLIDAAEQHVLNLLNREDWTGLVTAVNSPVVTERDEELRPDLKLVVLMYTDDMWQNKGISITGTIVNELPRAMEILHLSRTKLGV